MSFSIDEIIKRRKTQKVLAQEPLQPNMSKEDLYDVINDLLDLASSAPFHKKCHSDHLLDQSLSSPLPWRAYVLDDENCRSLSDKIIAEEIKAGKITNMLFAADALLLVTWLPDPSKDDLGEKLLFEGSLQNMEHVAAAGSAVQNILIGATGKGIPNYWSSGGVLRNEEMKSFLGIPADEILLGAIFLFPAESNKLDVTIKEGALRNVGKEKETWAKWIKVNEL